jgi:DNA-binding transcriptional LysR family regulator
MGRPKNVSDLYNHALVANRKVIFDGKNFSPSIVANNMSLIKHLTLMDAGIGLLSEAVVKSEKREGSLIQVLPHVMLPKVPIHLIFPHKKIPKRISAFAKEILESRI